MSGAEILGGMALLGAGVNAYGQVSAAQSQEEAQIKAAELKREQAKELLSRQSTNEGIMRERLTRTMKDINNLVDSGSSTGTVVAIAEYQRDAEAAILDSRREAEFKARMLREGADIETDLASDLVTGAYFSGAGTILTGAYKAYDIFKPASPKTKDLPGVT